MSSFLKWIVWVLIAAVGLHFVLLWLVPYVLMGAVIIGSSQQNGVNAIYHAPKVDQTARTVVRPAPDLAYTTCAFDLRDGALEVTMPKSQTYSSVSFFTDDTTNFFALNDREVEGASQTIILMRESDRSTIVPPTAIGVRAPTTKGLVLFRRVIPSEDMWPVIDAERRKADCKLIRS